MAKAFKAADLIKVQAQQFKDELDAAKVRVKKPRDPIIKAHYQILADVLCEAAKVKQTREEGLEYSHYLYSYSGNLEAHIRLHVPRLKDNEDLNTFLMWLLDNEFEAAGSRDRVTEWVAEREFTFTRGKLTIHVDCSVPSDGDTCRRVQTGVKLVEQPVYQIECL
jgi:hypothetical protein